MFIYFNGTCYVAVDMANAALVLAQALQVVQGGTYDSKEIPF